MISIFDYEKLEQGIKDVEKSLESYSGDSKEYILTMVVMRIKTMNQEKKRKEYTAKSLHEFIPESFLRTLRKDKKEDE